MKSYNYLSRPLCINNGIWGSGVWTLLHSLSFNYPDNPNNELINKTNIFLYNLRLPCMECETNYVKYISSNPPKLNSRVEFVEWVITFRNSERIFRGLTNFNKDEVIKFYELYDNINVYLNIPKCNSCVNNK